MFKRYLAPLAGVMALVCADAHAQAIQFRAPDNINNTPVSAATPLPVQIGGANATATIVPSGTLANGMVPSPSVVAESCHTYKATPGLGYDFSGYTGAAAWVMLFDLAAPPVNGAVLPLAWAYAPTAGSWSISYGIYGAVFYNGIIACDSSTGPFTLTLVSTNNVFTGRFQ